MQFKKEGVAGLKEVFVRNKLSASARKRNPLRKHAAAKTPTFYAILRQ